ncbi:GTPase ObgE [Pelotomaculum schinkii]|uniref:GTPase Obg n=1 Tax=Pelotomaculum schinkii TaxID=78350 RepID=A0A4Y7RE59_9FIRM|nr:GTPase ObgE [Pelotomaculum schinkii]TEB07305.1 GTPase ObgE [Pelotomaculum schinkii]
MFFDKARIFVKGGDGGNGCVAMRREKYVPEGGPWGGDGGRGGDIVFQADEGLRTLVDFRYKRHYKAQRGKHGEGKNRYGLSADDLVVRLPVGTVIRDDDTGELIADLVRNGQQVVVARGGRGGRGNAHFATPNNKAPKLAEKGEPGEERWLSLELKLLADVGLVGFPNAGKSTLISQVSAAKPKIANYPFTTVTPNLGVVRVDDGRSFVMADIPGLIKGAHAGAGLGHEFLRHVERTRLLIHVLDTAGSEGRDPVEDFKVTNRELILYNPVIGSRPQVIVANKMDLPEAAENLTRLKEAYGNDYEIFPISAATGSGLGPLIYKVAALLEDLPGITPPEEETAEHVVHRAEPRFSISREEGIFLVGGKEIKRHVAMTDLENDEAVERLQWIFKRMGIDDALKEAGIKEGDTVKIGDFEFEYVE